MKVSVGPQPEAKEYVTAPARVNPLGAAMSQRPTVRMTPAQLRGWADTSEWVRAAINHRRVQVSQSKWGVFPIDPKANYDPALQAAISLLFLHPNPRQKTFRELIEPMVEDILVLDRGVAEKESSVAGLPTGLLLVDGGTIRTKPAWSGDPADPRYEWWPKGKFTANLLDTQIILMMANPTSHRLDGFSPLEALRVAIDSDMEASQFNKRNVKQVSPYGLLDLGENVGTNVVDAFRVYWDAEIAGKKQMAIVGGVKNPEFINLGQSAREMQFMQWQVYLLRKIAAVFGIAPQDLGITFDVNRANAQTQQELSEDRGLRPLLTLVEEQLNAKVIADFARTKAKQMYARGDINMLTLRLAIALTHVNWRDHADVFVKLQDANVLNLAFKFRMRSSKSTRDQAEYNKAALGGFPWLTVNEARAEDGRDAVDGGDVIMVMTPIGAMPLEMIGGQMPPENDDQKRYIEGLLRNPPVVASRSLVQQPPIPGLDEPEVKDEPVVIERVVTVDEDGDEVED